jgi:hypothetical protein
LNCRAKLIQILAPQFVVGEVHFGVVIVNRLDDGSDHFRRWVWHSARRDLLEGVRKLLPRLFGLGPHVQGAEAIAPGGNFALVVERFLPRRPEVVGIPVSDARQQFHHSFERDLIPRICHQPKENRHILDVRLFEKADAACDLIGNPAARELELQFNGVIMRAIENRDIVQVDIFVAQLEDALRHELRLLAPVI